MNKVDCQLHVYDLNRCGIYHRAENRGTKSPKYLPIGQLVREIKEWGIDSKKPLIETSTYTGEKSLLEAFCMGISEYNGQYLIALWNKVPKSKNGVGVMKGGSPVENARVSHRKVGADDIPGYPSFFWILPTAKKVVGIKFEDYPLGMTQFKEFFRGFLTNFTSHKVRVSPSNPDGRGYSDFQPPKNSEEDTRTINPSLYPSFSISVSKVEAKQKEIIARSDRITKLVKDVQVYNSLVDEDADIVERISNYFNNLPAAEKKTLRMQLPVNLHENEVRKLIKDYNDNDGAEHYDVGFVFKGASTTIEWLSGASQKEDVKVEIKWKSEDQPDLDDLIVKLQEFKSRVSIFQSKIKNEKSA